MKVALRQIQPKRKKKRRTRKNQTCISRDISLSLFGREGFRVESVRYTTSGRRLGSSRRRPFRVNVKRSKLRAGRQLIVRARIATIDGRVVTVDRKLPCHVIGVLAPLGLSISGGSLAPRRGVALRDVTSRPRPER